MKSPLLRNFYLTVFSLAVIITINGCSKTDSPNDETIPVVITNGLISNLTTTGAQSGGVVTYNGGATLTASGVCYSSANQTPNILNPKTDDQRTVDAANTASFTSTLTGLTPGTTYYVRAYASNAEGTAYGSVVKFTTSTTLTAITVTVSTLAGSSAGGYLDGTGTAALFSNPQGVASDLQGNIYVADGFNNRIREITPAGVVTTFAGNGTPGYTDGPAANAEFYGPQGIAVDGQNNVYVADIGNSVIREITQLGIVSTFAGDGTRGYVNGPKATSEYNNAQGITLDAAGNMYVADRSNNVIRKVNVSGRVITLSGVTPGNDSAYRADELPLVGLYNGAADISLFNSPESVAVDDTGNVFVADLKNYAIRKVTHLGVTTTRAGGIVQTTVVGSPSGVALDKQGNLYVSDQTGRILKITPDNILYVLAGSYNTAGYVDGPGASAQFNSPQGITVDPSGNIYVADYNNNVIRKITVSTSSSPTTSARRR